VLQQRHENNPAGKSNFQELRKKPERPLLRCPKAGLLNSSVAPDHIPDVAKMPGGSLGEYSVKGKKCQIFIVSDWEGQNPRGYEPEGGVSAA
jgi:hypothetical protein